MIIHIRTGPVDTAERMGSDAIEAGTCLLVLALARELRGVAKAVNHPILDFWLADQVDGDEILQAGMAESGPPTARRNSLILHWIE